MSSETLDSEVAKIQQEGMSALAGIFVQNLDALKGLDFNGLISGLRSTDYVALAKELWQMERITQGLEQLWEESYPHYVYGTRRAKVLELPAVVIYEALAKTFGDERKDADFIWESYLALMNGRLSVYNNNPLAIGSALQCVPDDSLLYIRRGLPKVFSGVYVDSNRDSIKRAEQHEFSKLAYAIVQRMGDDKACRLLNELSTKIGDSLRMVDKSIEEAGYFAKVTDYLEDGGMLRLYQIFARRFDSYSQQNRLATP